MRHRQIGQYWGMVGILALTYAGAGHWIASLLHWQEDTLAIWPPAGIALAALVLYGRQLWPGLMVGAGLLCVSLEVPHLMIVGAGIAITTQALIGERLLRQFQFSPHLEQLRDVFALILVAIFSTSLGSTLNTLNATLFGWIEWHHFWQNWWTHWLGDVLGILVITPILCHLNLLVINSQKGFAGHHSPSPLAQVSQFSLRSLEVIIWLSLLLGISWSILGSKTLNLNLAQYPLEYLPFTLIVWSALRFGQQGAIIANFLVATIAVIGAIQGGGPFVAKSDNLTQAILLLQAFMGVMTITALVLAAAVQERQQALERERLLGKMALRIRQSLDLEQILDTAVAEVRQFLQADRVFIGYLGQKTSSPKTLIVAESVSNYFPSILNWIPADPELFHELQTFYAHHDVRVISDTTRVPVIPTIRQYFDTYQVKASLAVPLKEHQQLLGILVVNQCTGTRHWQKFEIVLLKQLATQVTIAMLQAQLLRQVQTAHANLEQQVQERTQQLQQKMQELEQLNQLKDLFFHAVSHNLRTPIMGTLIILKNLLDKSVAGTSTDDSSPSPPDKILISRTTIQRMIQASEYTLNKVNVLLEVHSSQQDRIRLEKTTVALPQLVADILVDLESLLTKNKATVTLNLPENLPEVNADTRQLRRVWENLIINGVQHNPPGVNLKIEAAFIPSVPQSQSPEQQPAEVRCWITDNGVGIPSEQQGSLFELSVQTPQDRQLAGIQLGLYLCQQIVTAHGGKIGVQSRPGKGSTFWFTLPLASTLDSTV